MESQDKKKESNKNQPLRVGVGEENLKKASEFKYFGGWEFGSQINA